MRILSERYKDIATFESYQDTRNRLQAALDVLIPEHKYDPLMLLIDSIQCEIETIDIEMKRMKQEKNISEQKLKLTKEQIKNLESYIFSLSDRELETAHDYTQYLLDLFSKDEEIKKTCDFLVLLDSILFNAVNEIETDDDEYDFWRDLND